MLTYREKSRNTDFEQHANKIFTAIREIKPEYAEKRAIWELFQNALDIIDEKGEIKISKTEKGLKFVHNGRPFNDGNLTGLIKQSSNGKTYGSNKNEIGQYGTGFLSTHVYGKQIYINGTVSTDRNEIKNLNNFLIDRRAKSTDELRKKIQQQDDQAAAICDGQTNKLDAHLPFTSFEYVATEESKHNIVNMLNYVHSILPFIFVFNRKLYKVEVQDGTSTKIYTRGTETESSLIIIKDTESIIINFLKDVENVIKVVLPQPNLTLNEIPKLFLFFPLMETQNLGVQFVIHAQEFKPNRERDYLLLNSSNPDIREDIETNKKLLDSAFKVVLDNTIVNQNVDFLSLIDISYVENEHPYIREKKSSFINKIRYLERIPVGEILVSLNSICYLDSDILALEEDTVHSIYTTLKQFYNLPEFELYISLSRKVNNWDGEEFQMIGFEKIIQRIFKDTSGNYLKIIDKQGYQTLVKVLNAKTELLSKLKAIPNIHNELRTLNELRNCSELDFELIQIIDAINAKVSQYYLHSDFDFLDNISKYTREEFKDDLNKFNGECIQELERETISSIHIKFTALIEGLFKYISLNKTSEINKETSLLYKAEYGFEEVTDIITTPTVILQYDSSFKLLARLHVSNLLTKKTEEIKDSIKDLKRFIQVLHSNSELKNNLLDKLKCFPNQEYSLKNQDSLRHDHIKDEDFKNLHDHYLDQKIRKSLVLEEFEKFTRHSNSFTGQDLGGKIEEKLNPQRSFSPSDPKMLPVLIELVGKIANNDLWQKWLPNIDKVKNEVMLTKFKDKETGASLFKILSGDETQIKTLGELAEIEDLNALIEAGKVKQKEERRKKQHLNYIKKVGLKIQDMIKSQLDTSLAQTIEIVESTTDVKLKNVEEQNGQDFIIYQSGIPIYYIEVKSRWDTEGIVALSKRQVERCSQNKNNYAVITVNVADYKSKNGTVEDDLSFEELNEDIYINIDLGENFKELIQKNREYETIDSNTKLIEFRGHIPQERIRTSSIDFNEFVARLKSILMENLN